jgi:hypothetical protein
MNVGLMDRSLSGIFSCFSFFYTAKTILSRSLNG